MSRALTTHYLGNIKWAFSLHKTFPWTCSKKQHKQGVLALLVDVADDRQSNTWVIKSLIANRVDWKEKKMLNDPFSGNTHACLQTWAEKRNAFPILTELWPQCSTIKTANAFENNWKSVTNVGFSLWTLWCNYLRRWWSVKTAWSPLAAVWGASVISWGWHTGEMAWGPLTGDLADADTVETRLWAEDQSVAACLVFTRWTAITKCNYWLCVCGRQDGDKESSMMMFVRLNYHCVSGEHKHYSQTIFVSIQLINQLISSHDPHERVWFFFYLG